MRRSVFRIVGNCPNSWTDLFSYCSRLIKDGLCDRSNAPSVSAISRLLRGRDGDDDKKLSDGEYTLSDSTVYVTTESPRRNTNLQLPTNTHLCLHPQAYVKFV